MTIRDLFRITVFSLVIGGTPACSLHSQSEARTGTPAMAREAPRDTTPRVIGAIEDTDRTVWPDPVERTEVRIEMVRRFVADYFADKGVLPASLIEILPVARNNPYAELGMDAWNHALRYVRAGTDYQLRSAGPDGRFETADDIVTTRTKATKMYWPS